MRARRPIPVSAANRKKRGDCRLCGNREFLTWTHVPSRSAGNVGTAQAPVIVVDDAGNETYGLARERLGGIRERWFCARCNNGTEPWDRAFAKWADEAGRFLHRSPSPGNRAAVTVYNGATGDVVRCLWAWMFAVCDPPLRERIPDIADAVRSGRAVDPPKHPRLFLALTRELQIGIQVLPNSVVVCAPPFVAILLSQRALLFGGYSDLLDVTSWLGVAAGESRTVELEMPIVEMGPLPMLGEPVVDGA